MTKKIWKNLTYPLIATLVLAMLTASYKLLMTLFEAKDWEAPKAGDWATWFGAIGTILTLAGTIVIATTESRRRRSEDTTTARLAAAGMYFQQLHNTGNVNAAIESIDAVFTGPMRVLGGREFAQAMIEYAIGNLEKMAPWSAADLLFISPLPDDCAVQLAAAQGRVASTLILLRELHTNRDDAAVRAHLKIHKDILTNASLRMSQAGETFGKAVDRAHF